jgi:prolyl-tRNA editing enzyme YbaK/EbsC (Cys-tRNA(Pro) deacylase)
MTSTLSPSAQKVQDALHAGGFDYQVIEFTQTTRTSADAAAAVGCQVGQIAKSIVFRGKRSQAPILVIASGANRIDEKRLRDLVGEPVDKADADFVRAHTGYAIGGVPPLGHSQPLRVLIDQDLLQFADIWAAAGTANAVFRLLAGDLVAISGGQVAQIT